MDIEDKIYDALDGKNYALAKQWAKKFPAGMRGHSWLWQVIIGVEAGDIAEAQKYLQKVKQAGLKSPYIPLLEARICQMENKLVSAKRIMEKAVKQAENVPRAFLEKYYNLLATCERRLGENEASARHYRKSGSYADKEDIDLRALEYSNYLFSLHNLPDKGAQAARQEAAGYQEIFAEVSPLLHRYRQKKKKLRIGIISPDIRRHVVICFSYVLFTQYDRENFELYAYALNQEDAVSERIKAQIDGWRNLYGYAPEKAARLIYEDEIDILVDLAGHSKNNPLPILAYKPAPVQISGIGFFSSTGLKAIDYFLGDVYLDDDQVQEAFTEELLILPHSHFCYRPFQKLPIAGQCAYARNGYVTFGSFNDFPKINEAVLVVWKEILRQLPTAHLLLKAAVFGFEEQREYALQKLERAGLPMERVECRPFTKDYLQEYGDMDIALDTFPYPGGGTSCDALYMSVPLITLDTGTHGGRFGCSLLKNIGLPELCAHSPEEYIKLAVTLGSQPDVIQALHENIRPMMQQSPLMDAKLYMSDMEVAYAMVWEKYCDEQFRDLTKKDLPCLVEQLKKFHRDGDKQQALAIADRIRVGKLFEEKLGAELAIFYLDAGEPQAAEEILHQLADTAGNCYLQAEAAAEQEDYEHSDQLCAQTLKRGGLLAWQHGAVHHRLAENAKLEGNVRRAAQEYLLSSQYKTLETGKALEYSNYLFCLHFFEESPNVLYQAAKGYQEVVKDIVPFPKRTAKGNKNKRHKIRVGYISADFCRHVVANFSQVFFTHFDKEQFEVYAYFTGIADDITAQFEKKATVFRSIGNLSISEQAKIIYEDELDILVDLTGHSGSNALPVLAYRPALVQLSGIGYFATTGLSAMDYFLVDRITAEETEDAFFTEKLLRLPHSHLCYAPVIQQELPEKPAQERNGFVTFGSLNQWNKVTDEMLDCWAEILRRVPDSRLFLKAAAFDNKTRREAEKKRLAAHGISLARVALEGASKDYLKAYEKIDIALDTYPYPGGGTTCDALYMGVPVVSRYGAHHHTRFGLSLLKNIGLEGLNVTNTKEYIERAVALVQDRELLHNLQKQLRAIVEKSPWMNSKGYMQALEKVYREIYDEQK